MIRVFIGYDGRESAALYVLQHSIARRASEPVEFVPLMLASLTGVFTRPRDPLQSTDFSFTRFLTPYLCNFEGWALFMDSDMLMLDDIAQLWALRDERYALQVVKHHHVPKETTKFLNEPQSKYEKKNWSSVMPMNCAKCRALTPDYVNTASGLQLHQFKWLDNDDLIGELPHRWNHLVGYDAPMENPANVHHTLGGPYYDELRNTAYAAEWFAEQAHMLHVMQRPKSM